MYQSLLTIFITLLSTYLSTTLSLPISVSSSSSDVSLIKLEKPSESQFCQSHVNINQIYNIGQDIYLALNSRSIYRYDVNNQQFYKHRYDINELFGKNKFKWVDTVISLNGVCKIPSVCQGDERDKDLERIHIVIGGRVVEKDRIYGVALYNLNVDDGRLHLLDRNSLDQTMLTRLNRTGLDINMLEREGVIMYGSFWPSQNGIISSNLYYRSGLFVPDKLDLFFSVYDTMIGLSSQRIIRRQFKNSKIDWENLNDQIVDAKFIAGMFNFAPKHRTFALTDKMQTLEFVWTNDHQLKFTPKGSIRELLNCYNNCTELDNETSTMTAATSTTTTTTITTTTTSTTTTTEKSQTTTKHDSSSNIFPSLPKSNNIDEPKIIDTVVDHDDDDVDDDSSIDDEQEEKDEIPLPPENETPSLNDLDHQRDDPNNANIYSNHKHNQRRIDDNNNSKHHTLQPELAEASARGPLNPYNTGLVWTFAILMIMLIILIIIIIVPILIIRYRSRKNQMNFHKKPSSNQKKKKQNGLDQSNYSEEVQLMNTTSIDK